MKGRNYRAAGGGVEEGDVVGDEVPNMVYAGEDSNVVKEAKDRSGKFKKGGKVSAFGRGRMSEGTQAYEKLEHETKLKKAKKDGGCAMGAKPHARLDRAKRATGGPLSTAAKVTNRPGGAMEKIDN